MASQNGIIGQENPTQIPQTEVPEIDLTREKHMALFSQSDEFKALNDFVQGRMNVWRTYLPGASGAVTPVDELGNEERGWRWLAADAVIREFQGMLDAYTQAEQAIKDGTTERTTA